MYPCIKKPHIPNVKIFDLSVDFIQYISANMKVIFAKKGEASFYDNSLPLCRKCLYSNPNLS